MPSRNASVITYSDVENHVATSILFRHDTLAANVGHPVRSEHQTVYRLVPTGRKSYAGDSQRDAFDYIEVRAVYLGKYFVGDVKDFIPESFWADANNTRNMVTRRYFLPGSYEYLRYAATGQYSGSRITKVGAGGGLAGSLPRLSGRRILMESGWLLLVLVMWARMGSRRKRNRHSSTSGAIVCYSLIQLRIKDVNGDKLIF